MSRLLDTLLPLEFVPSIPGLLVSEPKTTLEHNLAYADWLRAYADMDEMSTYAMGHMDELKKADPVAARGLGA